MTEKKNEEESFQMTNSYGIDLGSISIEDIVKMYNAGELVDGDSFKFRLRKH